MIRYWWKGKREKEKSAKLGSLSEEFRKAANEATSGCDNDRNFSPLIYK